MTPQEKKDFLDEAKRLFRDTFAMNHLKNTTKLQSLESFNDNPFLVPYLSQFAFGNQDPESLARVLLYPRVLGTSATTSFGNYVQDLTTKLQMIYPSSTAGMDIDFIDAADGRRKYCQLKSGPQTINKDDIAPIIQKCTEARRLIITNKGSVMPEDFIIGVCYGTPESLSTSYRKIAEAGHPVFVGREFWYHLTGDPGFYQDLISALSDVANEIDGTSVMNNVISLLAGDIRNRQ